MTHPLVNQQCNNYNIFFLEKSRSFRVIWTDWLASRVSAILLLKWPIIDDWALFSIWTTGWNFIHTICGRDLYFSGIYQKYNFNSKFIKSENFYIKNSEESISLNWCPPKDLHWSNWSTWSMTSVTSFLGQNISIFGPGRIECWLSCSHFPCLKWSFYTLNDS